MHQVAYISQLAGRHRALAHRGMYAHLPAKTAPVLRLNHVCPYYTMFPLAFPFQALHAANPGDWVLDPFCGRGTTLFAARLRGLPSCGIDSSRVAVAIAAAKLTRSAPDQVVALCRSILDSRVKPETPDGKFWGMCFHQETLLQICKIREHLLVSTSRAEEVTLRAIVLGILHGPVMKTVPTYLSNQMPRTYATKPGPALRYWSKNGQVPRRIDVLDAVKRRCEFVLREQPPQTPGFVYQADSRELRLLELKRRFSWVICSPPYYGMRTYVPDQWLRNWFVGGSPEVEYAREAQISHAGESAFVRDLASVWKGVSEVCKPGAHLIIRFGVLPSVDKDASQLIMQSIRDADVGWKVRTWRNAGSASAGRRQADQFMGSTKSVSVGEIDVYATLES